MSKGTVHTLSALVMTLEYTVGAAITLQPGNLEYALGSLLGVILNPDLDVDHGKVDSYKVIKARFGTVPHFTWRVVWYVYRKSLRHGSSMSHFPIVGTVGRITYLFVCLVVVPYLVIAPVLHLNYWGEVQWWFWQIIEHYRIVLGLMGIDFIHWVLDITTKEYRKEKYYGRNRQTGIDRRPRQEVGRDSGRVEDRGDL